MDKVNSNRFFEPVYNLVLIKDNEKEILAVIALTHMQRRPIIPVINESIL